MPEVKENGVAALEHKLADYERWFRTLDDHIRALEQERQKLSSLVNHTDIGFVLLDGDDRPTQPILLRTRDISEGGVCITCRHPLKIHRRGVVQLVRSGGRRALTGVEVRHCQYLGDETHEVGLKFTAIPDVQDLDQWLDDQGTPKLFDALLSGNPG